MVENGINKIKLKMCLYLSFCATPRDVPFGYDGVPQCSGRRRCLLVGIALCVYANYSNTQNTQTLDRSIVQHSKLILILTISIYLFKSSALPKCASTCEWNIAVLYGCRLNMDIYLIVAINFRTRQKRLTVLGPTNDLSQLRTMGGNDRNRWILREVRKLRTKWPHHI